MILAYRRVPWNSVEKSYSYPIKCLVNKGQNISREDGRARPAQHHGEPPALTGRENGVAPSIGQQLQETRNPWRPHPCSTQEERRYPGEAGKTNRDTRPGRRGQRSSPPTQVGGDDRGKGIEKRRNLVPNQRRRGCRGCSTPPWGSTPPTQAGGRGIILGRGWDRGG